MPIGLKWSIIRFAEKWNCSSKKKVPYKFIYSLVKQLRKEGYIRD